MGSYVVNGEAKKSVLLHPLSLCSPLSIHINVEKFKARWSPQVMTCLSAAYNTPARQVTMQFLRHRKISVLTAVAIKSILFWNVTHCTLVNRYQNWGRNILHILPWRWKQHIPQKDIGTSLNFIFVVPWIVSNVSNQRDAVLSSLFIVLQNNSTCFGCPLHLSSGVHKTGTTGTSHVYRWHRSKIR